jgi:hypothetical protein
MNYAILVIFAFSAVSCGSNDRIWKRVEEQQSKRKSFNASDSRDGDIQSAGPDEFRSARTAGSTDRNDSSSENSEQDSKNNPEDIKVLPPTAVAGGFLSDCFWSDKDNAVSCRMASKEGSEKLMAKPAGVEKIGSLFLYRKSNGKKEDAGAEGNKMVSYSMLKDDQKFVKIDFTEDLKGSEIFAKFNVTVGVEDLNFKDVMIAHIPPLRPDTGSEDVATPPLVVSKQIESFKLGDDGLSEDVECPTTETEAETRGNFGRALSFPIEAGVDNPIFTVELKEACGNTVPAESNVPVGRFEIWDDKGNLQIAGDIPSRQAGDMDAGTTPLVFKRGFSLRKGNYTFAIVPGPSPTKPGRLNDFVMKQARISGVGITLKDPVITK